MRNAQYIATRWLGVGLAAILAVVTISLAVTGQLGLYINPDSTWFAVSMAVVVLVGAVASFTLPLGAEADHGHDHGAAGHGGAGHGDARHGDARAGSESRRFARTSEISPLFLRQRDDSPNFGSEERDHAHDHDHSDAGAVSSRSAVREQGSAGARVEGRSTSGHHTSHPVAVAATVVGGVAASGVVVLTLVLPPASLSAELAMSRDVGATPLFGGADTIQLASAGDTAAFGVGEWATTFATATDPEAFDGDPVELTGFVTPSDDGDFDLTRLVITHCVIDAQPASVPISAADAPETGQWVTVSGTIRSASDGSLVLEAESVDAIPEPEDPYEY